jgi:ribosomal protein S18 acetylase RimI-like enzyme
MAPSKWFVIVMQGRCPQCDLEASAVAPDELAPTMQVEAGRWAYLLKSLEGSPSLRARPEPDVWSALEYGAHVRDTVMLFAERAGLAFVAKEPVFEYQDQDAAVAELHYNQQDPRAVARGIAEASAAFGQVLQGGPRADWRRGGTRRPGEWFDMAGLARFALHETRHHRLDAERSASVATENGSTAHALGTHEFRPDDEPQLFAAYAAVLGEGGAFPREPPARQELFRAAWLTGKTVVIVASTGDVAAGSYWLAPNFPGRASHIANAAYLVAPRHRRQGVGRTLVLHSLEEAKARGFDAMMFNLVLESNPSRDIYEQCGFRPIGRIPVAVDQQDAIIYWKDLRS